MRIGAVVAEYNPFHNGHKYQLECFRREQNLDYIIVVMSGNFVQRGEPAICDKRERSAWAIMGGADMVIELPVCYVCANAEAFAHGAVATAAGIGDCIGFGSEISDIALLKEAATIDTSAMERGNQGKSYPRELYEWINNNYSKEIADVYSNPNATLAIEYIKAANRLKLDVDFHVTPRKGAGHNSMDTVKGFASASLLRERLLGNQPISDFVPEFVSPKRLLQLADLEKHILYSLRSISAESLAEIAEVREGLENLFIRAAFNSVNIDELLTAVKSKRYTMASLKRICINAALGVTKDMPYMPPQYLHILAVRAKARRELFGELNSRSRLKILTNFIDYENATNDFEKMLKIDSLAGDLYSLFYNDLPKRDYYNKLMII